MSSKIGNLLRVHSESISSRYIPSDDQVSIAKDRAIKYGYDTDINLIPKSTSNMSSTGDRYSEVRNQLLKLFSTFVVSKLTANQARLLSFHPEIGDELMRLIKSKALEV